MNFDRAAFAQTLKDLASQNVFLGTSSWKYAGWCGQIYELAKYEYRGKFAETRFERNCLREYAEIFKSVCVDAAFYRFPDRRYLDGLVSQVSDDFRFSFKVTDEITIRKFPNLPRHGQRAGATNENFLNADLFADAFLKPCNEFRKNVGLLMFEFARFYPSDFARGRDFVEALDQFLGKLPAEWSYGVEIRNANFLQPEYFAMLRMHNVAHVYNSWTEMPSVAKQMALPGSRTSDEVIGARFLLKPGRKYEDAVKAFSPYSAIKETNEDARTAGASLLADSIKRNPRRGTYIYVNNRLEGNAIETLLAMVELSIRMRSMAASSSQPAKPSTN
jgi:uncharacterized protein YecE (DUF72 family)